MLSGIELAAIALRRFTLSLGILAALLFVASFESRVLAGSMLIGPQNNEGAPPPGSDKAGAKKDPEGSGRTDVKPDAKPAPGSDRADNARLIEALEERIRMLEEKLSRITDAPKTDPKKDDDDTVKAEVKIEEFNEVKKDLSDIKDESKKDHNEFSNFFHTVELSGIVDGYYSYNTNKVDLFTQGRAFDVRHNSFSLQLAKMTLERKNSKENPFGFRLDLGMGETVDRIISVSDSSNTDATKHLMQAYVSYVAPVGNGLTIDFGKMFTPVGLEVIETKDNFNYSRGWLFAYGPYYHAGLRVKYGINDKVAVSGFLFNGWDNLFENNVGNPAGKTVGFQIGLTPVKRFSITGTYLAGPEAPLANVPDISARDNWRHVADSVLTFMVNDKLTLMGNFVYGSDADNDGNRGHWSGFAGYLKYAFNNRFAFSPRFEVFNDKYGLRTGAAQTVKDITLTQEIKLVNGLISRFEYRRDFSNQPVFTNSAGAAKYNQNTFIVGLSLFFSTREQ